MPEPEHDGSRSMLRTPATCGQGRGRGRGRGQGQGLVGDRVGDKGCGGVRVLKFAEQVPKCELKCKLDTGRGLAIYTHK